MLVVDAMLDLLLVALPSESKGFSASNPPPAESQCGQYPISLHITDEIDMGMRVSYMFVDGRVVKGGYHTRGIYGTFHHPRNGNTDGDPWYYFRANPPEGWLRVLANEANNLRS